MSEQRVHRVAEDLPRYKSLGLAERLIDRGDMMKAVPMIVVQTMKDAADRIRYLEYQLSLQSNKQQS